jgi:alpha-1,3-rhamnosyl/mannosyltransferase
MLEQVVCFNGSALLGADEQLRLVGVSPSDEAPEAPVRQPAFADRIRKTIRAVPGAYKLRAALLNRRFDKAAQTIPGAVYHEPNFILKPYRGPAVTTVHDLSFIHYPQCHPKERVDWLTKQLPKTLERADAIITDSDVVRRQLIESFCVPEDRVSTVYLGADDQFRPRNQELVTGFLSRFGLVYQSYVLFVGTLEPRKGVDVLIDAWRALPDSVQQAFPLVLAGASGWGNSELLQRIKSLAARGRIHYLNYVPADALPLLYSGAALFVYPSIYEGFGLPVLEAMSSGVPVICRAGTSMVEFSQGACMLCETGEIEELADKIAAILESPIKQKEYAQKGLSQAMQYSWARCAQETISVYRSIS